MKFCTVSPGWKSLSYINKYESIHTIYPIFIEDDSYWFTDEEVKDLYDASKTINNLLTYRLEFYTSDNSLIDNVTLNTINNIEYSYIKANFSSIIKLPQG